MFKSIYTIAIALIFLVTGVMAVVGAGKLVNTGFDVLLKVEDCSYDYRPDKVAEETCSVDTNQQKKDVASGLAMLLVSLPVAMFAYRKMK